jgi:thioredoxin 1
MTFRVLAFAIAFCASFALLTVIAMRSDALSPGSLAEPSTQLGTVPLVTTDAMLSEVTTASHERSPQYAPRSARPIDVAERQFDRLVTRGLVLVKFGAEWCGPCRRVVPELEQLASDNAGDLTVLMVDVDSEKRLAKRHDVGSIPRMILFRDGKQIDDWTGFQRAGHMQTIIDRAKKAAPKGELQSNPFAT